MTREPLLTVASATAVVTALIALLVAFGVPLTDTQTTAILGVVAASSPLIVGLLARPKVTPIASPQTADGTLLVPANDVL